MTCADTILTQQNSNCRQTAGVLNAVIEEYTRGDVAGKLVCSMGFLDATTGIGCAKTAAILADALDSYTDGTFAGCEMTTFTSTPTTTFTSSPTTTGTSSLTTTTTPTFTGTTTPSTTATTTTETTSATTTPTTSATTTPTSTTTTTMTTSPTTTAEKRPLGCFAFQGDSYIQIEDPTKCADHVKVLNQLFEACDHGSALDGALSCEGQLLTQTSGTCSATAAVFNAVIKEYTRGDVAGKIECNEGLPFMKDGSGKCLATTALLNDVVDSYAQGQGDFKECQMTTFTTSPSTTATSTPTTTAPAGELKCHEYNSEIAMLSFDSMRDCNGFAFVLNKILYECDDGLPRTVGKKATQCEVVDKVATLRLGDSDCKFVAALMDGVVTEYSRGTVANGVTCVAGGYFSMAAGKCPKAVGVLNSALASFVDGTFEQCEMTTPTTSATTTLTTTTTGTSSLTTTPSTTQTTSPTTTPTNTLTTSQVNARARHDRLCLEASREEPA